MKKPKQLVCGVVNNRHKSLGLPRSSADMNAQISTFMALSGDHEKSAPGIGFCGDEFRSGAANSTGVSGFWRALKSDVLIAAKK